jgi:sugar O-acyltransferase (sialic acid O-acetyltransferase NeuD family)
MIAISDPETRNKIVERLPKETKYFTFIHPTALIMGEVEIGEGSFIGAYSILTSGIKIGNHAILNRGNHIGHDCIIGNYFSAMPGAIVSGNVHIGNRVYMGTNSSIIEKKYLLHDIKLGANSVVVRDINESGVYVGCPSKKVK